MNWGREIRSVQKLLAAVAAGGKLQGCEPWQVSQDTGWCQYWLDAADGQRHPVRTSIYVAAFRRGLVRAEACAT